MFQKILQKFTPFGSSTRIRNCSVHRLLVCNLSTIISISLSETCSVKEDLSFNPFFLLCFFLQGVPLLGPQDSSPLAHGPTLSFKFIGDYSAIQPPYWGPHCSASLLLLAPNTSWQPPRFASLSFPTLGIYIECVPAFPFLRRIFYMSEFALFILCSIYWRLIRPVRSSTSILQCFLSSLLIK